MTESLALRLLNKRMAELMHQYEIRTNVPRKVILEELSELAVIRDEIKKIQQSAADRPQQLSRCLPNEFPTLGVFVQRVNRIAQLIVKTQKNDPHRAELLNEITRLCLVADSLYKREL